jgi:enoyl-[acyl-carrier protein] reductase/trans-2-enoyl-CoA reductase (NAD+)
LRAESINGDAFSTEVSDQVIARLKAGFGPVQYVFYSLASPTRTDPVTGVSYRSVLKPTGRPYVTKSIDLDKAEVIDVSFEPATDDEIAATVAVMGGDDLRRWVNALLDAGLLAPNARVIAYSYVGPEVTWPIYRSGTIGKAKEELENTAVELDKQLQETVGGHCWVSVNKAVVTQASAAIPAVPLYISLLYKAMKEKGLHEEPIHQVIRMMRDHVGPSLIPALDAHRRIRLDDWEMREDVQAEVTERWEQVTTANLNELSDFVGYKADFRRLFGFDVEGVDYDQAVETSAAF